MSRKISEAGRSLIKQFEGFSPVPYVCPAGVLTIGYGHTREDVDGDTMERWAKSGRHMSEHEADIILSRDLENDEEWVDRLAPGISDAQFSALVSFCFNVGPAALARSTLLKFVQQGLWQDAADQFDKWVYGGGKVLPGLVKRRAAEKALFLSGCP
jgi:lysozyme